MDIKDIKLSQAFNEKTKFVLGKSKVSAYRYFPEIDQPEEIQKALENKLKKLKYKHINNLDNDLKNQPILLKTTNAQGQKEFTWLSQKEYFQRRKELLQTKASIQNDIQVKQDGPLSCPIDESKLLNCARRIEFSNKVLKYLQKAHNICYTDSRWSGKIITYLYTPNKDDLGALNAQIKTFPNYSISFEKDLSTASEISLTNPILIQYDCHETRKFYEISSLERYIEYLDKEFEGKSTVKTKEFLACKQEVDWRISTKKYINSLDAAFKTAEPTKHAMLETSKKYMEDRIKLIDKNVDRIDRKQKHINNKNRFKKWLIAKYIDIIYIFDDIGRFFRYCADYGIISTFSHKISQVAKRFSRDKKNTLIQINSQTKSIAKEHK